MAVWFLTGKLGSGKSLAAVGRLTEYLSKGVPVATNLDIFCDKFKRRNFRPLIYRLPDKPTLADMQAIGVGNSTYDENKNGLIVLDECGTWFNSRNWSDKDRQPLIDWFLHARKLGWDLIFIIQDISLVDKQAREALAEHVGYCRRWDRIPIPFLGRLLNRIHQGAGMMPKLHMAIIKYGDEKNSLITDRWFYRGSEYYSIYDTKQIFKNSDTGVFCYLTPWHLVGRYLPRRDWQQLALEALRPVLLPCYVAGCLIDEALRPLRSGGRRAGRVNSTAFFHDQRTSLTDPLPSSG